MSRNSILRLRLRLILTYRRGALIGLCLIGSGAWAQAVWKCEQAGQVIYSNRPCISASTPLDARSLRPNLADGPRPEAVRDAMAAPSSAPPATRAAENVCPGDGEIAGMVTRASSTTLGDEERLFLEDEVRRARQCRSGRGRYTNVDWEISRQAQAAQTRLSGRDRRDARLRAEAMHAAADPEEAAGIARRHDAEDSLRLMRQKPRRSSD